MRWALLVLAPTRPMAKMALRVTASIVMAVFGEGVEDQENGV